MKVLKWLIILVLVVLLLPIVVGVVVSMFIDPNDFKPQIIAAVEKNTRGSLAIDGELSWSLFPSIGVEMNDVTFRLPEDKDAAFAALDSAKLSVAFMPLLRMAVEANGVAVSGLDLNMYTDPQGNSNWENIFPETTEEVEEDSADSGSTDLTVDIAKVEILDSSVTMENAQEGSKYVLEDFDFESTNIKVDGTEFPVDMSFNVALSDPVLTSRTKIKTDLAVDLDAEQYRFADLNGDFNLTGETFGDKTVNLSLNTTGAYNGASSVAELTSLSLNLANELKADIQGSADVSGKLKLGGEIDVEPFNLNKLLAALGMDTVPFNNSSAMSDVAFKGTLSGPANSLLIQPVTLKLDSSTFQGRMGITNLDTNAMLFEMKGDKINIDDYATAPSEAEAQAAPDEDAALLPVDTLRDLVFNAQFTLDEMIAGGMTITGIDIGATGKKGLIELERLVASLYEGNITMAATVDATKADPAVTMNTQLNGVNIKNLMVDFAEMDTLSGQAGFNAQFNTRGNTSSAFKNNLNGMIKFGIDDAVFSQLNADKLACQAIAQVRQSPMGNINWPATTVFDKIGGTFNFTNGIGKNDDMSADLKNLRVVGDGELNLPASTVDYRVALRVTGDLTPPGEDGSESPCAINEKYRQVDWPIRCKGNLSDDPGSLCGVDVGGLADIGAQLVKLEAQRQVDLKKDELKEKLAEKLGIGKKDTPAEGAGADGAAGSEGAADAEGAEAEEESIEDKLKKELLDKIF